MTVPVSLLVASSKESLSGSVAQHVLGLADEAVRARGKFTIALSGGSMPQILSKLGDASPAEAQWEKWHVFFTDERCVPLDDAESNYRACKAALFDLTGIPTAQIHAVRPELSPADMAEDYARQLASVFGDSRGAGGGRGSGGGSGGSGGGTCGPPPVLDAVLLGMGPDGHTASLFPGHSLLTEVTDRWVAHIEDSPKPPPQRITLTLPVLNAARAVTFIATGASKAPLLPRIFRRQHSDGEGRSSGGSSSGHLALAEMDAATLPAARVRPHSGRLTWYVDDEGAAQLPPDAMELASRL